MFTGKFKLKDIQIRITYDSDLAYIFWLSTTSVGIYLLEHSMRSVSLITYKHIGTLIITEDTFEERNISTYSFVSYKVIQMSHCPYCTTRLAEFHKKQLNYDARDHLRYY